jgi:hypothetical protein
VDLARLHVRFLAAARRHRCTSPSASVGRSLVFLLEIGIRTVREEGRHSRSCEEGNHCIPVGCDGRGTLAEQVSRCVAVEQVPHLPTTMEIVAQLRRGR